MVRRLVEQQRLRMAEQRLREQHADLLSALQLGHLAVVQLVGNIEALKQNRGVALGRVAVLFADDALELAEAHAGFVRHLGFRVQLVALGKRLPQPLIAHDDRVDHAKAVERVLILAQHAQLGGPDDGALLGIELAGQQLHEGRLAGAVGAGQAVAPARRKGCGDVLEERLRAISHRHAAY